MVHFRGIKSVLALLASDVLMANAQDLITQNIPTPNWPGNHGGILKSIPFDNQSGFDLTFDNGSYTVLTSYHIFGCSGSQSKALQRAVSDAVDIASYGIDELHGTDDHIYFIDFNSRAAIDYFSPSKLSGPYQNIIFNSISAAASAYPGWGIGDWFANRYVYLDCSDNYHICKQGMVAYTFPENTPYDYPGISFCSKYFKNAVEYPAHSKAVATIMANKNQEKSNVFNMQSQATVMLHEWLHIQWGSAKVFAGKNESIDWDMEYYPSDGPTITYRVYNPGPSKNLAKRRPDLAYQSNDNYVYFCAARYMQKRFGQYPQYPAAWRTDYSPTFNFALESRQPGNPSWNRYNYAGADVNMYGNDSVEVEGGEDLPISDYPSWYWPILAATNGSSNSSGTFTLPPITTPDPASDSLYYGATETAELGHGGSASIGAPVPTDTTKQPKAPGPSATGSAGTCPDGAAYGAYKTTCVTECQDKGGTCLSKVNGGGPSTYYTYTCQCGGLVPGK